jgi:glycosyltransferase involved in cell wall biosynthesis
MTNDLTIIIKTFHRYQTLEKLIKSISMYYPSSSIIILDDSYFSKTLNLKKKYSNLDMEIIITEPDIGLSKGRNLLLEQVKTRFFLLCDDDYLFHKDSNLGNAVDLISKNNFDIIGGKIYDIFLLNSVLSIIKLIRNPLDTLKRINKRFSNNFLTTFNVNGSTLIVNNHIAESNNSMTLEKVHFVKNFFIGNTESIRKIRGWIPEELKLNEHTVFFLRAMEKGLLVGYSDTFYVEHIRFLPLKYVYFRLIRKTEFELIETKALDEFGIKHVEWN